MDKEDQAKKPVNLTREELYVQVWEIPMSRLAAQYGISGNGLAKICDRLKVPYPPRGYWAKRATGKKVVTYRLPEADEGTQRQVTITRTPPPAKPPQLPAEVQAQVEVVRAKVAFETVSQRLLRPHPIIAGWLAEHERQKQEARRERDPSRKKWLSPGEFTEADKRRHRILDALFKALEGQGGKVREGERRELFSEFQDERIEFHLKEKMKQVRRPLNDEEKRWHFGSDKGWKQELQPTGKLSFAIKTYLPDGLRTTWLETEEKPMENLLPDIVVTFVAAGPLLIEQRRRREEAERQRQIVEQKRHEENQRRKLDDNRWRRLVDIANAWRSVEVARDFLAALRRLDFPGDQIVDGRPVSAWIAWAEDRLGSADPLNHGVEAIFKDIAQITQWTYRD